MPNPSIAAFIDFEISPFIRTDGHGKIDSAGNPDQEYIHFMRSEFLVSTFYILCDESSVPFYSTSNY